MKNFVENFLKNVINFVLSTLTFVFPRDRKLWVFGNKKGFIDNTSYFILYVAATEPDIRAIWLAHDDVSLNTARSLGLEAYPRSSILGSWLSIRSGIQFFCNGFGDLNRGLAVGARVINFWHGTPIKKVYFDSLYDQSRFGSSWLALLVAGLSMRLLNRRIFAYYASNSLELDLVTKAARIPKSRSRCFGSPRYDHIRFLPENSKAISKEMHGKRVLMYAPTWRENGWNGFSMSDNCAENLVYTLRQADAVLIVKRHPLTGRSELNAMNLPFSSGLVHDAEDLGLNDINILFKESDLIITDISSLIFDSLVVDVNLVLFMPDVEDYLSGARGIYPYFEEVLASSCVTDWQRLVEVIISHCKNDPIAHDYYANEVDALGKLRSEISKKTDVCHAIFHDIIASNDVDIERRVK